MSEPDLDGQLEAFVITNGRSTFDACYNSVEQQQRVKFKITVHKDMGWLEANQKILKDCKSKFFVRIDDDMILHKHAIAFMWKIMNGQSDRIALRGFRLWEPYSYKVVKGLKGYNLHLAQTIGFRISKIGKIDKLFSADAAKRKCKVKYGTDVLGIHACGDFKEHLQYALMRGEDRGKNFSVERAWMKQHINAYPLSIRKQARLAGKFLRRLNREQQTKFAKFMVYE